MDYTIQEERLTPENYIAFLRRTDLGSQYPKERFEERIAILVKKASISLTARDAAGDLIGVCFGIMFITDLGVVREWTGKGVGRALVKALHRRAGERLAGGGEKNIIMYTCANENATGFYEKLGMTKPNDIYMLNRVEWTDFTVE